MKKEAQLSIKVDASLWADFGHEFTPLMRQLIIEKAMYTSLKNKREGDVSVIPFGKQGGEPLAETSATRIKEVFEAMRDLVLEKNKRYGDAALKPRRMFSKLDSNESIKVRLDDKLARIENSDNLRTNDICDLLGYLGLLLVAKGVDKKMIMDLID